MIGPSLSVDQTVPSRRRKLAPALSSPPKQHDPSKNPCENHLNPTGTSNSGRPSACTTLSIRLLLTTRLADGRCRFPFGPMREQIPDRDREVVIRVHEAADGVTIP